MPGKPTRPPGVPALNLGPTIAATEAKLNQSPIDLKSDVIEVKVRSQCHLVNK